MIIGMTIILMTSCRNAGTFEIKLSSATPTMETGIVGVVGRLKTMEVPLQPLVVRVRVGGCRRGGPLIGSKVQINQTAKQSGAYSLYGANWRYMEQLYSFICLEI